MKILHPFLKSVRYWALFLKWGLHISMEHVVIGAISVVAVFTIIIFSLYLQSWEKCMYIWAWSWLINLVGLIALLFLIFHYNDNLIITHTIASVYVAPLLLYLGSCEFFDRPVNKSIILGILAAGIFNITGIFIKLPFMLYFIPACICLFIMFFVTGRMFLQDSLKSFAGWFMLANGVHILGSPFLYPVDQYQHWGYFLTSFFFTGISISLLVHYFQNRNNMLARSEAKYQELADFLPDVVYEMDLNGRLTYVNKNAFAFWKATREDYDKGLNVLDFIVPEDRTKVKENIQKLIMGVDTGPNEYTGQRRDGTRFPVIIRSTPIYRKGKAVGFRGFIIDITERKKLEMKMQYLSCYDALTGLKSRYGFQQDVARLLENNTYKLGVIICDVDGLKLVNDTMGHHAGDEMLKCVARIIKKMTRDIDVTARVGGDEFCIVVPVTRSGIVEETAQLLRKGITGHNKTNPKLPLSLSVGYAIGDDPANDLMQLYKQADDFMYRNKLHHSQSNRSAIVQTLMKALKARDFITEGHAERLQDLVIDIASIIRLSEEKLSDLRLLAQFHDIGKVGIPDRILFKPGPLTGEEKKEMERHCEIGFRIARSSNELASIAEWVLRHHEWWNGEGYPLGLKREEIPLECRILAIADAYDAMTSDRPYRKAMSHFEALVELKAGAGTQFDPHLIAKFIKAAGKNACDQAANI